MLIGRFHQLSNDNDTVFRFRCCCQRQREIGFVRQPQRKHQTNRIILFGKYFASSKGRHTFLIFLGWAFSAAIFDDVRVGHKPEWDTIWLENVQTGGGVHCRGFGDGHWCELKLKGGHRKVVHIGAEKTRLEFIRWIAMLGAETAIDHVEWMDVLMAMWSRYATKIHQLDVWHYMNLMLFYSRGKCSVLGAVPC